MADISQYYEGEVEKDGTIFKMVDTNKIVKLFEDLSTKVEFGKKTAVTRAYKAQPGEIIITTHGSVEENRYTAEGGEVVFDNGGGDKFVPRDGDGNPIGDKILAEKYELVSGSLEGGDASYIPQSKASQFWLVLMMSLFAF